MRTGAGLIIDGRLHRGIGGVAGEVGLLDALGWASAPIAVNELGRELEVYRLQLARSSRPSLESAGGSGTGAPRH
jgi:hypothetical protein